MIELGHVALLPSVDSVPFRYSSGRHARVIPRRASSLAASSKGVVRRDDCGLYRIGPAVNVHAATDSILEKGNRTVTVLASIVAALAGAFAGSLLSAHLTLKNLTRLETEKTRARKRALGIGQQTELAHIYRLLHEHRRLFEGYKSKVTGIIGGTSPSDYPILQIAEKFYLFDSCVTEAGIFENETSYGVIYCYHNIRTFLQLQSRLIGDLPELINSSCLSLRANDLASREVALMKQIERIIGRLARESEAIPFQVS